MRLPGHRVFRIRTAATLAAVAVIALVSAPVTAAPLFWSLFNIEGESATSAQYVSYGSAADMFSDTNRLGIFTPNAFNAGRNIVGSGAFVMAVAVPAPGTLALFAAALVGLVASRRQRPASA